MRLLDLLVGNVVIRQGCTSTQKGKGGNIIDEMNGINIEFATNQ